MRPNGIEGTPVAEIMMLNGFDGSSLGAILCADGGGRIDCYRLFDGVMAMRIHLETRGLCETRELLENLAYFDREYLIMKTLELFMPPKSVPQAELNADYCPANGCASRAICAIIFCPTGTTMSPSRGWPRSIGFPFRTCRSCSAGSIARRFAVVSRKTGSNRPPWSSRAATGASSKSRSTPVATAYGMLSRRTGLLAGFDFFDELLEESAGFGFR